MRNGERTHGGYSEDEKSEVAKTVMQNVIDTIAPLSDEGFRRRAWVEGTETPGCYSSSSNEVADARALLERFAAELGRDYRFPPWIHRPTI
jgi:hypothetical protein